MPKAEGHRFTQMKPSPKKRIVILSAFLARRIYAIPLCPPVSSVVKVLFFDPRECVVERF